MPMMAITIIGILAAIGIPQYTQYKIRAYDAHSKQALKDMHLLCNAYWLTTQEKSLTRIQLTRYETDNKHKQDTNSKNPPHKL
jgi:Tfp pilus assembly protein PilE